MRPWLWPNLLSLDAPIVAILWQQLFTKVFQVPATKTSGITLAATVWLIYAGDRILDAWQTAEVSARHRFYRRHWRAVTPVILGAAVLSAWCAFTGIRQPVLFNGIGLLIMVAAYLAVVHITPGFSRRWWPKELAVAIIFALGATIHVWTFATQPASLWVPSIAVFGVLCWINCAAISYWEKAAAHGSTAWLGRGLREVSLMAASVAIVFAMLNPFPQSRLLYAAEALAALGFFALSLFSRRLSPDALRVAADVVLCTPALFLLFA
jgi:hypothetical protein